MRNKGLKRDMEWKMKNKMDEKKSAPPAGISRLQKEQERGKERMECSHPFC